MRNVAILFVIAALTGCQSGPSAADARWNDMWTDIALRHHYERYSCGYRAMHGCPPGTDCTPSRRVCISRSPRPEQSRAVTAGNHDPTTAQAAYNAAQALSQKIDVLEEALKSNASATNQNQALIVSEIVALKKQLTELQGAKATPSPSPRVSMSATGIKFGN